MKGTNTILSRLCVNYGDNIMALEIVAPIILHIQTLGQKKSRFQVMNRSCFTFLNIMKCMDW
jgi:hypothetical protein